MSAVPRFLMVQQSLPTECIYNAAQAVTAEVFLNAARAAHAAHAGRRVCRPPLHFGPDTRLVYLFGDPVTCVASHYRRNQAFHQVKLLLCGCHQTIISQNLPGCISGIRCFGSGYVMAHTPVASKAAPEMVKFGMRCVLIPWFYYGITGCGSIFGENYTRNKHRRQ